MPRRRPAQPDPITLAEQRRVERLAQAEQRLVERLNELRIKRNKTLPLSDRRYPAFDQAHSEFNEVVASVEAERWCEANKRLVERLRALGIEIEGIEDNGGHYEILPFFLIPDDHPNRDAIKQAIAERDHAVRSCPPVPGGDLTKVLEEEKARRQAARETLVGDAVPIRIVDGLVLVNNKLVPLGMTPEKASEALAFLRQLLQVPGNWCSGSDIGNAENMKDVRFDRVYNALPRPIKSKIQSIPRKGYRVKLRGVNMA
jgi:hypothetical protein